MSIIEKALDKIDSKGSKEPVADSSQKKSTEKETLKVSGAKPEPPRKETSSKTRSRSRLIDVDIDGLTTKGYLTPQSKNKTLFEQYRRIKMPILKKAFPEDSANNKNIIMVSSSVEGEGKSFTSTNLAMSIAYEYNHTVLLVDADITKRMISNIFGVKKEKGLIDYLVGDSLSLSDFILKTNIPKLNILPSGSPSEHVTELFNSKKMDSLIKELADRYSDRIIIIDTPPVLQDSSSEAIKGIVDQILFVVEAEKTPQHIVEKALEIISNVDEIGVVLNKSNQRSNPGYYYSY